MNQEHKTKHKTKDTVRVIAILPQFRQYWFGVFEQYGLKKTEFRALQQGEKVEIPKALWEAYPFIFNKVKGD